MILIMMVNLICFFSALVHLGKIFMMGWSGGVAKGQQLSMEGCKRSEAKHSWRSLCQKNMNMKVVS